MNLPVRNRSSCLDCFTLDRCWIAALCWSILLSRSRVMKAWCSVKRPPLRTLLRPRLHRVGRPRSRHSGPPRRPPRWLRRHWASRRHARLLLPRPDTPVPLERPAGNDHRRRRPDQHRGSKPKPRKHAQTEASRPRHPTFDLRHQTRDTQFRVAASTWARSRQGRRG